MPIPWINPDSQGSAFWFSKCLSVLDGNLSRGQINLYYAVLDSATGFAEYYPTDSNLIGELRCPAFELLGAWRKNSLYNGQFTFHFTFSFVLISMQRKKREIVDK